MARTFIPTGQLFLAPSNQLGLLERRAKVTQHIPMIRTTIVRLFCMASLVVVGSGCNKEEDTIAIIQVNGVNGLPVAGAYIKLWVNLADPQGDVSLLFREETTDSKGQAKFDYTEDFKQGQAGFAILDILSTKDTLRAEGIIKIKEEETTEETVVLKQIP
jgi:hypothetical protein